LLCTDSALFCEYYNVVETGNWEHTNILWVTEPLIDFAERNAIELNDLKAIFTHCHAILLANRNKRIRPQLDDKILLGWNALLITALCKAYAATGIENYKKLAVNNAAFIENKFAKNDASYQHTYKNNQAKIPAFLDDYAYLIQALIQLQEISGNSKYLLQAKKIIEFVVEHFSEADTGFFYFTHQHQTDVIVRKKEVYDGAVPSGNATMAANLRYLSIIFDKKDWLNRSINMTVALGNAIVTYPTSFGVWASNMQMQTEGFKEIVITGLDVNTYLQPLLQKYVPNKILQTAVTEEAGFELQKGKAFNLNATFYSCKNYQCEAPENNFVIFLSKI
ncbi:MAG: thioredoxin domain-containing protein, partial [Deinococcales bacterium]|nr:thioredoxin domain-containing protein [Chitinophagaceae bacterium]